MLNRNAFRGFPAEKTLMKVVMQTSSTVWRNELTRTHINSWLSNFTGEVFSTKHERLLALLLLRHFTFYNQAEVEHLCRIIYLDLVHHVATQSPHSRLDASTTVESFFDRAAIIAPEQVSGSGGFIAYIFRHVNDLPMTLFNFSIDNLSSSTRNILIIDDVTLTPGDKAQVHEFLSKVVKQPNRKFFLLTLLSSDASIAYLQNTFNIQVITAIKLDSRDRCFDSQSDIFSGYPHLRAAAEELARVYGRKILKDHPLGYQDGQCTFGFYYNTPDNTLPIFWGNVGGWQPIINRFHKNYGVKRYLKDERFI